MNTDTAAAGTYVLLLQCEQATELAVGRLGFLDTAVGYYLYVGSAYGPGGIRARVKHHRKIAPRPHWHIDYLRTGARLVDAWCAVGVRQEHDWALALMQCEDTRIPLPGFGSSDCDCSTHLFYMKHRPDRAELEILLKTGLYPVDSLSGLPG